MIPWLPVLLLALLLLPTSTSFAIGTLRLTPYRVLLLAAVPPLGVRWLWGAYGRLNTADVLVFFAGAWAILAFGVNAGIGPAAQTGGIFFVELCGGYLVGRCVMQTDAAYRGFVHCLLWILVVLAPLTVLESITGRHLIQDAFAAAQGTSFTSEIGTRHGFYRAYGPFDHPILYGTFAAACVSHIWFEYAGDSDRIGWRRLAAVSVPMIAAATSLSAGAFAAMGVQVLLITWERLTRGRARRWWLLLGLLGALYLFADALSNRSGMHVFLSYLTFSEDTAYDRLNIWQWGFYDNVLVHPIFGIGAAQWVRPDWWAGGSMDNFWLVNAVTFGTPVAIALLASVMFAVGEASRRAAALQSPGRLGPVFSLIGLGVAGATVHFWNSAIVAFALLLGICAGTTRCRAPSRH